MTLEFDDFNSLHRLKARYGRFVDCKEWDGLRDLLTADMRYYADSLTGPPATDPTTTGREEFVHRVAERFAGALTVHHSHTPDLEITGDRTATGVWAMSDYVTGAIGDRGWRGYGFYYEEYQRCDDGTWRIRVLRLTRIRMDSLD